MAVPLGAAVGGSRGTVGALVAADGSPAARRGKRPYMAPRPSSVAGGLEAGDTEGVADGEDVDAAGHVGTGNMVSLLRPFACENV